jgi:hypothetical protein
MSAKEQLLFDEQSWLLIVKFASKSNRLDTLSNDGTIDRKKQW